MRAMYLALSAANPGLLPLAVSGGGYASGGRIFDMSCRLNGWRLGLFMAGIFALCIAAVAVFIAYALVAVAVIPPLYPLLGDWLFWPLSVVAIVLWPLMIWGFIYFLYGW